ncbi:MAG: hypothetical protein AB1758_25600, partial [Candidatus Eremiobacterota bacterium]
MTITHHPAVSRLTSRSAPVRATSRPEPGESFTRSAVSDNVKGTLALGAIALVGAGIGVYAGLGTGILAGLAGAVAGATGGASAAAHLPGQHIRAGALIGAIG